jgi:hypothetical protein
MGMRTCAAGCVFLAALLASCSPAPRFETRDISGMRWFKGVTHVHARSGESDASVRVVSDWYRNRGYRFCVITDHDVVTRLPESAAPVDTFFLCIPGEEITAVGGGIDVEISGLGVLRSVPRIRDATVPAALDRCIEAVRAAGGKPVFNHPNYRWRLADMDLARPYDCFLFELHVGFPGVNNAGDASHPGLESAWDSLLTAGRRIYGVASDDAHVFRRFSAELPNPGRGWVSVLARRPDAVEIVRNLEQGLFYSSTGVEIASIRITDRSLEIEVAPHEKGRTRTEFIGASGRILRTTEENPAVYRLNDGEIYVRGRILRPDGARAWVQPVFTVR